MPFRKPKRIRTAFSPSQLLKLEQAFEKNQYVVGAERKELAKTLNLSETQVRKEGRPRIQARDLGSLDRRQRGRGHHFSNAVAVDGAHTLKGAVGRLQRPFVMSDSTRFSDPHE